MPKRDDINKVLIIGSGPITIGQAAEFDYAGAQACLSLREEGIETVLLNSNPATIMTDNDIADRVYIEPMTIEVIDRILEKEKPQGIIPTLGGQTGLNLGMQIANAGLLKKYNVELLGTQLETIFKAEDREAFRQLMIDIGESIPESEIVSSIEESRGVVERIGLPLIIRPAYTMGGAGGGIAFSEENYFSIVQRGLDSSPVGQILVEQYIGGMKEIEYEVMRDSVDNCITICNMENFDPVGVHTGDSIVVAPSQTLSDKEYQMLRSSSLKIIRALGVEGGCNIQFALDPHSLKYYVIEVNPRVSRSSALASKATGYPIARIAVKIAIGLTLDEIPNAITQKTVAAFEPALDYCVLKIPRFPFDKFPEGDRSLGSQMKATGEVMSIDRTFEGALMKAIRSLDSLPETDLFEDDPKAWKNPTDLRLFLILDYLRSGGDIEEIHRETKIDRWFLRKLSNIIEMEKEIKKSNGGEMISVMTLKYSKKMGFSDGDIGKLMGVSRDEVKRIREENGIFPTYKMVDTCAGEFEAATPYFYGTWEDENEANCRPSKNSAKRQKAIVIGSGPIRIGQGIEFDYCSVHAARTLRKIGVEAIMVNNNPETVSTDFDVSDRLFFEPLTTEDIENIYYNEIIEEDGEKVFPQFIVQFGGQTSLTLASELSKRGILDHKGLVDRIELASNRDRFEKLLRELGIPYPPGKAVNTPQEAIEVADSIGYPVLVRPSFVLGGRAMEIMYSRGELERYIDYVFKVSPDAPVLVDRYISGREAEVDLIFDGEDVLIPGIMEHVERAGIHSGDSFAVYPSQSLSLSQIDKLVDYSTKLAKAIGNKGLNNIQYVIDEDNVYVIEANPRGSRTIPFLSKVTGIPMVELATKIIYGYKLADMGYLSGLYPESGIVAVKAPVFSFSKLDNVSRNLGPEMKSTGEVMGIDRTYSGAMYKAFIASGTNVPLADGTLFVTVADRDKEEVTRIVEGFEELGFSVLATSGTARVLRDAGINVQVTKKISEDISSEIIDSIKEKKIDLVINTPTDNKDAGKDGPLIRQISTQYGVPCLTSLDTARALLYALRAKRQGKSSRVQTIAEYVG